MAFQFPFLNHSLKSDHSSLGEFLEDYISKSSVQSLVDCICSGSNPAIHSFDTSRPPLLQDDLRDFVAKFALPQSFNYKPLGRNNRVMVVLPPGPENALALLAIGNYHSCAPVNVSCTITELKEDILRLDAKAIVTTEEVAKRLDLKTLQANLGCSIIYLHARLSGPAGIFDMSIQDDTSIIVPSYPTEPQGLDDISLILHTSGTSGKKKVVRYSLKTLLVGTLCVIHSWDLKPDDRNLNMMPLFHVGGIVRNLLAPVLSGGSVVMCAGFDPNAFWTLAEDLQATWYYAAPTVHHAILSSKPDSIVPSKDLSIRLICNAAGGLLPSLAVELRDTFGAVVLPSYGMTECMPITSPLTNYRLDRPGCSGIARGPRLSIRQVSDIESEVAAGQTGAICVRGPPTFDGYEVSSDLNLPLDRSCFSREGWFDTGDVGYIDKDGYLYITGRSKEIINRGGEVISPFEVEDAVLTAAIAHVKTALAFSIEHDILQETIGLVIVPDNTRPRIGLQQLHDKLKGHLHPSKWPFAIVYMDKLPENSAGKPLRIALADRLGIGKLTDNHSPLQRHFEATLARDLSEEIACANVKINVLNIAEALRHLPAVEEVALRHRPDGSLDAYLSVRCTVAPTPSDITQMLALDIPSYEIPTHIHYLEGPLNRNLSGNYDYDAMDKELLGNTFFDMSDTQMLVRDIVAAVLDVDSAQIDKESDFFLLGGNSLLLGNLSYRLRKQTGINIGIAELFSTSSIEGIAALIDERETVVQLDDSNDRLRSEGSSGINSSTTAFSGEYDSEQDLEYGQSKTSRGQNHPLSLAIQAIPFIFFYPFKTALTWTTLLFMLSYLAAITVRTFWNRIAALLTAILVAKFFAGTICPLIAIAFKWIVIGRYRPGVYRMWSWYYLRWWIVDQSLRIVG